jgi:hypothetical protein
VDVLNIVFRKQSPDPVWGYLFIEQHCHTGAFFVFDFMFNPRVYCAVYIICALAVSSEGL